MRAANGRFVWFDLMTTDAPGAKSFYGDIIGWKTKKFDGGDYELWHAGQTGVGGVMPMPEGAKKAGSPPHWLGYVATDDIDASIKRAQKFGGKVVVGNTPIPNVGRYAVLADPQGAEFGLYRPDDDRPAPDRNMIGQFSWGELNTSDWPAAWRFYSELFGWKKTQSMDMGPQYGEYFMFGMGDSSVSMGGMSNTAKMMKAPPHWLHYVNVPNTDEVVKQITQKGGKVIAGPMDVPGGDRIAQCIDPQGAMFAIYSSGPR